MLVKAPLRSVWRPDFVLFLYLRQLPGNTLKLSHAVMWKERHITFSLAWNGPQKMRHWLGCVFQALSASSSKCFLTFQRRELTHNLSGRLQGSAVGQLRRTVIGGVIQEVTLCWCCILAEHWPRSAYPRAHAPAKFDLCKGNSGMREGGQEGGTRQRMGRPVGMLAHGGGWGWGVAGRPHPGLCSQAAQSQFWSSGFLGSAPAI